MSVETSGSSSRAVSPPVEPHGMSGGPVRCTGSDPRPRAMSLLIFTMIYMLAVAGAVAYHLYRILRLTRTASTSLWGSSVQWPEDLQFLNNAKKDDLHRFLYEMETRKLLYIGTICLASILSVASIGFLWKVAYRQRLHRRSMVSVGWLMFLVATVVYGGCLVAADIHGEKYRFPYEIEVRASVYVIFAVVELVNVRFVLQYIKKMQCAHTRSNQQMHSAAMFDPRRPDPAISSIAARVGCGAAPGESLAPDPSTLFVLPSYTEAMSSDMTPIPPPADGVVSSDEPPKYIPDEDPPPYDAGKPEHDVR